MSDTVHTYISDCQLVLVLEVSFYTYFIWFHEKATSQQIVWLRTHRTFSDKKATFVGRTNSSNLNLLSFFMAVQVAVSSLLPPTVNRKMCTPKKVDFEHKRHWVHSFNLYGWFLGTSSSIFTPYGHFEKCVLQNVSGCIEYILQISVSVLLLKFSTFTEKWPLGFGEEGAKKIFSKCCSRLKYKCYGQ